MKKKEAIDFLFGVHVLPVRAIVLMYFPLMYLPHKNEHHNVHYANTPMQYTAIVHGCKNVHFQMKILDIFLVFAQNIDCGYTLEPPQ